MTAMTDIERRAQALADARTQLLEIVTSLNDGLEAIKRQHMKGLKEAVKKVAERHDQLKALIETNPALFTKPRTVVFHGLKVGMTKGKGALDWDDDEVVCKAIKRLLPDQAELLIKTTEKPVKGALQELPATTLKKIGVQVADAGDQVVIKATDSEVEKQVNALFKSAQKDAEEV
jgi:hypothetical protein